MRISLKTTGLLLLLLCFLPFSTVNGQQTVETITGSIGSYAYSNGQYTVQMYSDGSGESWDDRPIAVFTYIAEKDGRVYFTTVASEGERPFIKGRVSGSEWGEVRDGFEVTKGDTVEVKVWPYGPYVTMDENPYDDYFELVYTYARQIGYIEYSMMYYADGSSSDSELIADFDYQPISPSPGEQVEFIDTSEVEGAEIVSWSWYIDGEHVTAQEGERYWQWTPPSIGTYTVELEVTDSTGNTDFHIEEFTVKEESSYTVLDQAFTTGVENNEPVDRKTSFEYGEAVYFWMKLGNVKGSHKIYMEWETPRPNEIIGNECIDIAAPSTQGKTEWATYIVTASITTTESSYELLFRDPGYWKAKVWIDGEPYEYSFSIESSLKHEAEIAKTKLTTGEKIQVDGSISFNNAPVSGVIVNPELYRNGQLYKILPSIEVSSTGEYSIEETVPLLQLDSPPTGPENWSIKLIPEIDPIYGDSVKELQFQVLPLWIEVIDAEVVQITTAPYDMDLFSHALAADRQAGIRVYYRWTGAVEGYDISQVPARLECISTSSTITVDASLKIDKNTIISDHIFTLPEGTYNLKITLDPNGVCIPSNIEPRIWQENAYAKKMKKLSLAYLPVEMNINWDDPEQQNTFLEFVKKQTDFVYDVYPLPYSHFNYRVIPKAYDLPEDAVWDSLGITVKKVTLLSHLSKTQVFTNSKTVAVLPSGSEWWSDVVEEGMAYALLYQNAVLVQNNAHAYVSAHELGHTYGLYLLREQYNQYPDYGIEVKELILKDGEIYDFSQPYVQADYRTPKSELSDKQAVFNFGTTNIYCFMGRGVYNTFKPWASTETSTELYLALRDPPQPIIYFSGLIYENHTVAADPWFTSYGEPEILEVGDYTVKCLDAVGTVLYQGYFGVDGYFNGFGFTIPYPNGTETIQITLGDQVLYSKTTSQNPPSLTGINIQDTGERTYRITWQTSDIDGDQVTSMVQYSYDGGETWITLCSETDEKTCDVDLGGLPGGSCVVKVYSTDGINTVTGLSNQFNVEKNQPIASIFSPLSNITYPIGANTLEGLVYDIEDGVILNPTWVSSIDGNLGTGSTLEASLSAGTHTLTLTGTDNDGNTIQTQTTVNVASYETTITNHLTCGSVENGSPANIKDIFEPSTTVISYITLVNASAEDQIDWIYNGPNNLTYTDNYILEASGDWNIYSTLDLAQATPEQTIGDWTIQIYLNSELAISDYFTVEDPLTGYKWWGGFIGLAIIAALIAGGYILLKRRKKPETPQQQTPNPEQQQTQRRYCSECGGEATWIPQYQRWYCYKCKKYLE